MTLGSLGASGEDQRTLAAPALPPGEEALVLFDQPFFLGASGLFAASPTLIVLLDASL